MDRQERHVVRHQYITLNKRDGIVYVEGTYDAEFIAFLKTLPKDHRTYDPAAKRWAIGDVHLQTIINKARTTFTKVMYSVGGDYEEITVGGVTWKQGALEL